MQTVLLQAILSGLAIGGAYALVALGFSVTFTTTRTLNFAYGDFVSMGAFVTVGALLTTLGMSLSSFSFGDASPSLFDQLVALIVTLTILGALGALIFIVGVRPFLKRSGMVWIVSTLGFGLVVEALLMAIWGPKSMGVPAPFGSDVVRFAGVGVLRQELLTFAVATAVLICFDYLMRRSMIGKAMRAVALKPEIASLMGINVAAVMVGSYVVSAVLGGLSGFLLAPILQASLVMGAAIGLKGFAAAVIGGLDNARGCMVGGFLLGIMESVISLWSAQWREVSVLLIVIAVLALKPNGIFGTQVMDKV
jgi:branched-chain amino acid transport system permease protein